jgi:transposase InsO family protein
LTSPTSAYFTPDRGSNYTSYEFAKKLETLDMRQSVGRTGVCLGQRDGGIVFQRPEKRVA